MSEDFVWCDVRWDGPSHVGSYDKGHVCAENKPGHESHVCCCGAVHSPTPRPRS